MTVHVTIRDKNASEILELVHELRKQGLVQGVDFDFKYHPPEYDFMNGHTESKHTRFTFYNESQATLFALRWA